MHELGLGLGLVGARCRVDGGDEGLQLKGGEGWKKIGL